MNQQKNKMGTLGHQLMAKADKSTKDVFKKRTIPNPANEGVTHINLSSRSKVRLGRLLSTGDMAFTIPELGRFTSMEAFMLFIFSKEIDITIPNIGFNKALRHRMRLIPQYGVEHIPYLKDALRHILLRSPKWRTAFIENKLPFECYYIPKDSTIPRTPRSASVWLTVVNELKDEFTNHKPANDRPDYSDVLKRIAAVTEPLVEKEVEDEVAEEEHEIIHEEALDEPVTSEEVTEAIVEAVVSGELNHTLNDSTIVSDASEDLVDDIKAESETESTQSA